MTAGRNGLPRVAIVAHEVHEMGGMERVTAELVRHLCHDHELTVVCAQLDPELQRLVRWRRVRIPKHPLVLRFAVFFVTAAIVVRRLEVDIVHTVGAIIPNAVDVASVHFCHAGFRAAGGSLAPPDAPPTRRLATAAARAMALGAERWCYRPSRARAVAPVSEGVAEELRAHYPGVRIDVTPNGVDTSRFQPDPSRRVEYRSRVGVADDEVVVLFVGGDWDRKGLGIAVESLAGARRAGATKLRLWVVGDGDRARFESMARTLGVSEVVEFHGRLEKTEDVYAAADIFILPSLYEAFSLVSLEAAASGLPLIVAERVNGVAELIGDTDAGLIVPRDPDAFCEALLALVADPDRRTAMGLQARGQAERFSWSASADRVRQLYVDLLRSSRRADGASGPACD